MERLTDLIYDAALDPAGWQPVFDALSTIADARGAAMFSIGSGPTRFLCSPSLTDVVQDAIETGAMALNNRITRGLARNHPGFLGDQHLFTPEELANSRHHHEFLYRHGLGWCASTLVSPPSGDRLVLTVERDREAGPVPDEVMAKLNALRPHLARAALLSARLRLERESAAVTSLEMVGLPAAVLSFSGRSLAMNTLMAELVPGVIQDGSERLFMADRIADLLLSTALLALRNNASEGSRSIPLPAMEDRPPMVAHVVPVLGTARDVFNSAMALLVITPVRHGTVVAAEVIQGLFDLTPAEARVAHGIAAGQTAEELARNLRVSVETVRKHIAGVLTKTGLPRQAALVGLLAGSVPPGLG